MPVVPPAKPKLKLNSYSDRFLSHEDAILRRLHHVKELYRTYRNQYWGLMEEIRAKYSTYVWETGKSPFESDDESKKEEEDKSGELVKCKWNRCAKKAMPLTVYCFSHILEDKKQTLYKECRFITRRSPLVRCNKAVLRSKVPCYCDVHYMSTEKQNLQVLKNYGLVSSGKTAPKFFLIISAYIKKIKARRRESKLGITKTIDKMEIDSASMLPPVPLQKTDSCCKNKLPPIVPTGKIIPPCKNQVPVVPAEKIVSVCGNMLPPLFPRKTVSLKQRSPLQTSKGVMMHPTPNRMENGQMSGTV